MQRTDSIRFIAMFLTTALLSSWTALAIAQNDFRDVLLGKKLTELINSQPMDETSDDDELTKLLKARYNVSLEGLHERYRDYKRGLTEVDKVFDAARRVVDSRLDVAQTPEDKMEIYQQVLEILDELEGIYRGRVETLGGGESELIRIRYAQLTAKVESLRLQQSITQEATDSQATQ